MPVEPTEALTELESLDVNGHNVRGVPSTQVTDEGLKKIAKLTKLSSLDLGATGISDAGLKQLVKLKSLAILNLSSTRVTDAGVFSIGKLKNLHHLYLWHSQLTDSGVIALRRALPRCQINYGSASGGV